MDPTVDTLLLAPPPPELDPDALDTLLARIFRGGGATVRGRRTVHLREYLAFCQTTHTAAVPARIPHISAWLARCRARALHPRAIAARLALVRTLHAHYGYADPTAPARRAARAARRRPNGDRP